MVESVIGMRTAEKYALAVVSGVAAAELLSFGVEAAVQWFWSYIDRCNVKELEGEFQIPEYAWKVGDAAFRDA